MFMALAGIAMDDPIGRVVGGVVVIVAAISFAWKRPGE